MPFEMLFHVWLFLPRRTTAPCVTLLFFFLGTEDRLDVARKLGVGVINYHEQDVNSTLKELFPDGLDVAIECAGFRFAKGMMHKVQRALMLETDTPEIITECCMAVRNYGHVSVIADYAGFANNFPIGMIGMKHLTLASGQSPTQRIWKMALEKLRSGEYDPSFYVTHHMRLQVCRKPS